MSIGDRLREERDRLGHTQPGFAELTGRTKGSQINYEKNERAPDAIYLAAIAAAGADVIYILTGQRIPAWEREMLVRTADTARLVEPGGDGPVTQAMRVAMDELAAREERRRPLYEALRGACSSCSEPDFEMVMKVALDMANRLGTGQQVAQVKKPRKKPV